MNGSCAAWLTTTPSNGSMCSLVMFSQAMPMAPFSARNSGPSMLPNPLHRGSHSRGSHMSGNDLGLLTIERRMQRVLTPVVAGPVCSVDWDGSPYSLHSRTLSV